MNRCNCMTVFWGLCGVWLIGLSSAGDVNAQESQLQEEIMALTVASQAFKHGEPIPALYTCDGQDTSPPLSWSDAPAGTKSWVLISDDPDAPMGMWVHWVVYNLPPETTQLPEGMPTDAQLPDGTR